MSEKAETQEMTEVKIEDVKEENKDGKNAAEKPETETAEKETTLKVSAKPVEEPPVDLIDRDPNFMNQHCKVTFHEIIAEPDPSIYSFDKVWTLSFVVFTGTKLWVYRILSLICAIPLSVVFGVWFACLSLCNIWCWMPCLKALDIKLFCARRVFSTFLNTFFTPCFEAMGKCLSSIRVVMTKDN